MKIRVVEKVYGNMIFGFFLKKLTLVNFVLFCEMQGLESLKLTLTPQPKTSSLFINIGGLPICKAHRNLWENFWEIDIMWLLILSVNHDTLVLYSFKRLHVYDFPSINLTSLVLNRFLILNHQEYLAILPKISKEPEKHFQGWRCCLSSIGPSLDPRRWCLIDPSVDQNQGIKPSEGVFQIPSLKEERAAPKTEPPITLGGHDTTPPPPPKKNYCNPL